MTNTQYNQRIELTSAKAEGDGRTFTFRAAVPGTIGTSPVTGEMVMYDEVSFANATFGEDKLFNINHNLDAKIGELVDMEVRGGDLYLTVEFSEAYSSLAVTVTSDEYDGISIETYTEDVEATDIEGFFIANSMVVTGLALLLAVEPACPKDECHLVSEASPKKDTVEILRDIFSATSADVDKLTRIEHMVSKMMAVRKGRMSHKVS